MNRQLEKAYELIEKELKPGYQVLYLSYAGSKLHGTDHEDSDLDLKGIYMPTEKDMILGNYPKTLSLSTGSADSKNNKEDVDVFLYSLFEFIDKLAKSDINAVELFFSIDSAAKIDSSFLIEYMRRHMPFQFSYSSFKGFSSKNFSKVLSAKENLKKLEKLRDLIEQESDCNLKLKDLDLSDFNYDKKFLKLKDNFKLGLNATICYAYDLIQEKISEYGYRIKTDDSEFKALSHALRSLLEAKELKETGKIRFPLRDAYHLREIKLGNVDKDRIIENIEKLEKKVSQYEGVKNDQEIVNDFKYVLYKMYFEV